MYTIYYICIYVYYIIYNMFMYNNIMVQILTPFGGCVDNTCDLYNIY